MLNTIWAAMILLSLAVSLFTGQVEETAAAAVSGAGAAVETCLSLLGILCLFSGLAKIGERAGLVARLARRLRPLLRFLFPEVDPDSEAGGSMVMNMVANLLGMGNAATPLGLKAMQDLSRLNHHRSTASNAMCMFVVWNTASLQLLPTTLISLRQIYGSAAPGEVILPIWISSLAALTAGVCLAKFLERRRRL